MNCNSPFPPDRSVRPALSQAELTSDHVIYMEVGDEETVLVYFGEGLPCIGTKVGPHHDQKHHYSTFMFSDLVDFPIGAELRPDAD